MSRKVSTCRSGRTSRCVSACGLMSRTATNPSPFATWSPSRASRQKRQSARRLGSANALLGHGGAADADELTDPRIDGPRRVVGAVAAPRPIYEDDVLPADLRLPA